MTWFKNFFSALALTLLLLTTFLFASFHAAVAKKPAHLVGKTVQESGRFIDKSEYGIHQLVLTGSDFERGYNAGRLGATLLQKQEAALFSQLETWIPSHTVLKLLTAVAANWFRGIQEHYETWALEEMYGVSLHAPKEGDFLADGFTRQIGYHGLHEVGQMLVDQGVPFACTAVVAKHEGSWIIGRNFDFEGGEVFDREKLMKWVFPDKGVPYLSVIWAGMVGATTGVNANGLYISLNAAGSDDFARVGTPSTLLITKALQFSNDIDEALEIFRREKMFITDIFVVADAKSNRVFRIEKSPDRTIVDEVKNPTVIANHLDSEAFKNDATNKFREQELTSTYRQSRGLQLLKDLKPESAATNAEAVEKVLQILRDKGQEDGKPLHLNNRRAIDALISAHSVIFDAKARILYVSRGPSLAGSYVGFDLEKSFATGLPVPRGELPKDPLISEQTYADVRFSERTAWQAQSAVKAHDCPLAKTLLEQARAHFDGSSLYHQVAGDIAFNCDSEVAKAKEEWTKALNLYPAYARDVRALKESLSHAN